METEPDNDVNLSVIGTGCATSLGGGCLSILVIGAIVAAMGVQAVRNNVAVPILGFLSGFLVTLAVGYFTARAARQNQVAVNYHVVLVGILAMVIGLLHFVVPSQANILGSQSKT